MTPWRACMMGRGCQQGRPDDPVSHPCTTYAGQPAVQTTLFAAAVQSPSMWVCPLRSMPEPPLSQPFPLHAIACAHRCGRTCAWSSRMPSASIAQAATCTSWPRWWRWVGHGAVRSVMRMEACRGSGKGRRALSQHHTTQVWWHVAGSARVWAGCARPPLGTAGVQPALVATMLLKDC